jgi:hypothetical protein
MNSITDYQKNVAIAGAAAPRRAANRLTAGARQLVRPQLDGAGTRPEKHADLQ